MQEWKAKLTQGAFSQHRLIHTSSSVHMARVRNVLLPYQYAVLKYQNKCCSPHSFHETFHIHELRYTSACFNTTSTACMTQNHHVQQFLLTLGVSLPLASSSAALAVKTRFTSGGCGSSATSTMGTWSTKNFGCHLVILSSATVNGLSNVPKNFWNYNFINARHK